MILGGDEIGRSQGGNNNAYCQDSALTWYAWADADEDLLAFTSRLLAFRAAHQVFRRRRFFQGQPIHGQDLTDIEWFTSDGVEMAEDDWGQDHVRDFGVLLSGEGIPSRDERGEPIHDDTFFLAFNALPERITARIPLERGRRWRLILDTAADEPFPADGASFVPGDGVRMEASSLVVLQQVE